MGIKNRIRKFLDDRAASTTNRGEGRLIVKNTGKAIEVDGGTAVTGYSGPPLRRNQEVIVKNTGSATASGEGSQANSGINYT